MSSLHMGRIALLDQVNTNGIVVARKESYYIKKKRERFFPVNWEGFFLMY